MLAALGFSRRTHIYLAGAHIYGGSARLAVLTTLFPNLVTKENLLSSTEMKAFANSSSQVNLALLNSIILLKINLVFVNDLHIYVVYYI